MAFAVIAPDHKEVNDFITSENKKECQEYIKNTQNESEQDRIVDNKEKTGVFT
jgi:leucyl-tRNA synthetase